jgi:hypothetical protein
MNPAQPVTKYRIGGAILDPVLLRGQRSSVDSCGTFAGAFAGTFRPTRACDIRDGAIAIGRARRAISDCQIVPGNTGEPRAGMPGV